MSLQTRLHRIEGRCGGTKPKLSFQSYFFENEEGGSDFGLGWAFVTGGALDGKSYGSQGESTLEEFKSRVCADVLRETGLKPIVLEA